MPHAKRMHPPLRLVHLHDRLPALRPFDLHLVPVAKPAPRPNQLIARLVRNPVIFLRKQKPHRRSGMRMFRRGRIRRRAPDILVPDIRVDLEHFVARHVQGLEDAVGGLDERGRGVRGVLGEGHYPRDEFCEQGEGEKHGDEACDDGEEEHDV